MEWLNDTVEVKSVLLVLGHFAFSFFVFGWIAGRNSKEDEMLGRKRFWVFRHYWNKYAKSNCL